MRNNALSPFCLVAQQKLIDAFANYESVWVSRQIFREFAAVVSREMLLAGKTDFDLLAHTIRQFEQDFLIAESSPLVTECWLKLLKSTRTSGKQVHDANIIATMQANDIGSLLTHNISDFQRFEPLVTVIPLL